MGATDSLYSSTFTTPRVSQAETQGWVKTSRDQRKYRDLNHNNFNYSDGTNASCAGGLPLDMAEEKRVHALRYKKLAGKTINGTFLKATGTCANPIHWIRWNSNLCDSVCVPDKIAREVFKGEPRSGVRVKVVCSGLGPHNATAWGKRPQCETFKILEGNTSRMGRNGPRTTTSPFWSKRSTINSVRMPALRSDHTSPCWSRRMTPSQASARSIRSSTVRQSNLQQGHSFGLEAAFLPYRKTVRRSFGSTLPCVRDRLRADMGTCRSTWRSRQVSGISECSALSTSCASMSST